MEPKCATSGGAPDLLSTVMEWQVHATIDAASRGGAILECARAYPQVTSGIGGTALVPGRPISSILLSVCQRYPKMEQMCPLLWCGYSWCIGMGQKGGHADVPIAIRLQDNQSPSLGTSTCVLTHAIGVKAIILEQEIWNIG